ncbi:ATP-binding cassette domain-containing protein [Porphyromonas sp. oral taxon 278]|uniref:ATP-binding cassette domain-containing protein n=1 Tax=Porphyromonas sp. oral taxon 278 TaxID=712437 RepID=UPI0025E95369|nr:ATP-binding cassette domain-containing protein [Porphyromonas sp. oral taxon 278]
MSHTQSCSLRSSLRREQAYFVLCLLALGVALVLQHTLQLLAFAVLIYGLAFRYYGERRRGLVRRVLILAGFISLSILPLALGRGDSSSLLLDLGGWGLTRDGLHVAIKTWLRCLASVGSMILLLQLLPLHRLYAVLRSLGIPKLFIDLVELTYRYIFVLEETAGQIRLAQTSRLGYQGGIQRRIQHFGMLLSRTFVLSQVESDKLYLGLVSRGYEDEPLHQPVESGATLDNTPVLRLEGISFVYEDGYEALHALSLSIHRGERIALIGHNGAGKSTLFLLLSGLQQSWQGELHLHGKLITPQERVALRRRVALVLQNSNYQLFTPSVEDELSFGLKNMGLEGEALHLRLEELLTEYQLLDLRHKAPHELSEGQKKWVALAAVLATDPEIIILDEPTAALDALYTERVLELLDRLHERGKTVIVSTHDMDLGYQFADRVLLLSKGKLLADRPALELWQDRELLTSAHIPQPWALRSAKPSQHRPAISTQGEKLYHLPLFLTAEEFPVLFIGGGRGVWRKAQGLIDRHIPFTILSPSLCPELEAHEGKGLFRWIRQRYTGKEDLSPARIIVLGIGDPEEERAIADRLASEGYLFSLLSDPQRGNIQFGATAHREGITLSVHSDYRLPEITQSLKEAWVKDLPVGIGAHLEELAQLRVALLEAPEGEAKDRLRKAYTEKKESLLQDTIHDRTH